jgi:Leucine-rich repeat (LRR) protein
MTPLQGLSLAYLQVTDASLDALDSIQWLERINLKSTSVSCNGIVRFVSERAHSLRRLNLANTVLNDGALVQFSESSQLYRLSLKDTAITDYGLPRMPKPPMLQDLVLRLTDVGDDGVRSLEECGSLTKLDLSHTKVTDTSLVWLCDLKIEDLDLEGTQITDAGLPALTDFSSLRRLSLDATAITNRGVRFLAECQQLQQLFLNHTAIRPGGLQPLRELPLTTLAVTAALRTPDLRVIAKFTKLQQLSVLGTRVSTWSPLGELPDLRVLLIDDAPKAHSGLEELHSLKHLILWGDEFHPPAVARIRLALPGCHVHMVPANRSATRLFRSLIPRV